MYLCLGPSSTVSQRFLDNLNTVCEMYKKQSIFRFKVKKNTIVYSENIRKNTYLTYTEKTCYSGTIYTSVILVYNYSSKDKYKKVHIENGYKINYEPY